MTLFDYDNIMQLSTPVHDYMLLAFKNLRCAHITTLDTSAINTLGNVNLKKSQQFKIRVT